MCTSGICSSCDFEKRLEDFIRENPTIATWRHLFLDISHEVSGISGYLISHLRDDARLRSEIDIRLRAIAALVSRTGADEDVLDRISAFGRELKKVDGPSMLVKCFHKMTGAQVLNTYYYASIQEEPLVAHMDGAAASYQESIRWYLRREDATVSPLSPSSH